MINYSYDILKKTAFEKELEHLRYCGCGLCELEHDRQVIEKYLEDRIKEIDETYKES